jgi:hypothetical protein
LTNLTRPVRGICCVITAASIVAGAAASTALASSLGKAPAGGTTSPAIKLVNLTAPGASPSFGQQVTFTVSTTATAYPWVELRCYQGGANVYYASVGYYPSYMFPQTFTLGPTPSWSGGAANCTASLVSYDTRRTKVIATLGFGVTA